ncbi:nucleolar protein 8-like [Nilaparvata lugens]|uniref:nucleolar protein 8-like n=1 Tax=Nilaparvata lugens TaxID=108931 RepID=UPI00193DD3C0|nr:nucleolar protein 8-like [Nilaparvata lugens]XP_039277830.1 nucleolar protein 8-like [Nilaparvata lugens]XP_039277831.1 nucleolar protein 8-like [Nilaparvata lugens]
MEVERRLYIGNLPSGVDENLIKNRFSKYGKVLGVELKQRKTNDGSQEDEILSTFAFIDISAKKEKLDSCLKKLSRKKWDGQLIKIDFAKESVLSRLERERKELSSANNTKNTTKEMNKDVSVSPALLNGNSKWFGSSARNYNGEKFEEEHKQKNKRKLESDNTQINEKMKKYSESKTVENGVNDVAVKSSSFQENLTPEQRRLKSLEEKMKMVSDRKLAVKAALSSVDAGNRKNKIIFKDDDDEEDDDDDDEGNDFNEPENKTHTTNLGKAPDIPDPSNKERHNLFDDSGDSDEETSISRFEVKEHFDGKKGQKLLKLQSRFGNDSRFALDQRFAESSSSEDDDDDDGDKDEGEEKEEDGESESKAKRKKSDAEEESGKMHVDDRDDDEVKRQLEILQNVVGHQIIRPPPADDAKPKKQKPGADKKRNQLCVRFDPTMAEHEKFIVKPPPPGSEEETKVSKKKKKNKNAEESDEKEPEVDKSEAESSTAVNSVEVSKETYYEVASDLKERLKSSGTGFSLSQLFSSDAKSKNDIEDDDWVQSRDKSKEGASISNKQSVGAQENNDRVSEKTTSQNKTSGLSKLWKESFFFKDNDDRLKEGADFFMRNRGQDASKNFSDRRQELKLIVKSKMKRSMRKDRMFKKKIGGGFPSKTKNFSRKRVGRFT